MAKRKPGESTRELQAKTLKKAHRQGLPWEDYEVAKLARAIEKDETTYKIAMSLGRSYYGVNGARAHVRFALSHRDAILG